MVRRTYQETPLFKVDRNLSIPVIMYAQLAGLTSDEAEKVVENRLREGKVVVDPQVSIFVKEYNNSAILVTGEVNPVG